MSDFPPELVEDAANSFSFSVDDYVMRTEDRQAIVRRVLAAIAALGPWLVDGAWRKAEQVGVRCARHGLEAVTAPPFCGNEFCVAAIAPVYAAVTDEGDADE